MTGVTSSDGKLRNGLIVGGRTLFILLAKAVAERIVREPGTHG